MIKYIAAAVAYQVKLSWVVADANWACFNRSVTPINETRAVSFNNTSHWLVNPGNA